MQPVIPSLKYNSIYINNINNKGSKMLNLFKYIKPMTTIKYAMSTVFHTMTKNESDSFVRQLKNYSWNPQIHKLIHIHSPPEQIAEKIIQDLHQSPLKSIEETDKIIKMIKGDFKLIKPFYLLNDKLKIMRIALRLQFPQEIMKWLENFLISIDDEKMSLPMLLLYESICQQKIRFSIGKDEILYDKICDEKFNDIGLIKQFLAISDIVQNFIPSKIIAILCKQSNKKFNQFDNEELIEIFKIVSRIKHPQTNFLVLNLQPFLQKALNKIIEGKDVSKLINIFQEIKHLRLDITGLIQLINNNPEQYLQVVNNFDYRSTVDNIFKSRKLSVPKQFVEETKTLLLKYFQSLDTTHTRPLDYFMQNLHLLEEKHKPILSNWFNKITEKQDIPRSLRIKLLKFGSQFANKKSLRDFIDKSLGLDQKLDFELVLNGAWLTKIHKIESGQIDVNSLLLKFVPDSKVSPQDFIRLIQILYPLKPSFYKDQYVVRIENSLSDILKRTIFGDDIYLKIIHLYKYQQTFKDNKKMYVNIQHAIITKWQKELPSRKMAEEFQRIFMDMKVGTKLFGVINNIIINGKRDQAKTKIEGYLKDLQTGKFKEGSEWWN